MMPDKPKTKASAEPMPSTSQPRTTTAPGPQLYQGLRGLPVVIVDPELFANIVQNQGNKHISSPKTVPPVKSFDDAKPLGAIQISIGLVHIGFGVILGYISIGYENILGFISVAFISGYPFWGGLSFIITGVLSIIADKDTSPYLKGGNIGMNILSAIFAVTGVILLLVDESGNVDPQQNFWAVISGKGISAMLIIFSILEFCITITTAWFASGSLTKKKVDDSAANDSLTAEPTKSTSTNDGNSDHDSRS